jgi:UDP-glucose 4-epimerase
LKVVVGRFFNVVGPRQVGHYGMVIPRFIDQAMRGAPVVVYDDGSQVRCFAHVSEVIDAVIRLMETPAAFGRVFNIGSDQPIAIVQLAREIIRRTKSSAQIQFLPYHEAYGDDFEDVRQRVPDLTRLEQTIGSKPVMPLTAILDDILRWKRENLETA